MRLIIPDINTNINDTYLGIGYYVIDVLNAKSFTIDECYNRVNDYYNKSNNGIYLAFETFIISVIFLYTLNILEINEKGEVILK
ncbi:MAG: hypothetical protein JXR64_13710 [Spirochaetales bacterium]|nr:hypothetical protein [Spirochaetales bacterium]